MKAIIEQVSASPIRKKLLEGAKRLVIKIGSNVLASLESGLDLEVMENLVQDIVDLRRKGYEMVIVSSGAILAGTTKLGLKGRPTDIPLKQAVAAVGQTSLMWAYEKLFSQQGQQVAQVLLTRDDLSNRRRYLNARHTLFTLLHYGVVPIINENDTVMVEEIKLGDNDTLSALVTSLVEADLLIILSDIEGLCTHDPYRNKEAKLISIVEQITPEIEQLADKTRSQAGTGGMLTKIKAAQKAACFGVPTVIAQGRKVGVLSQIMQAQEVGTLFLPRKERLCSRKQWIAHALRPLGKIIVDAGAQKALIQQGKSLLPSGIVRVEGKFGIGDAVSCLGPEGKEFARGLTNYGAPEVEQIRGRRSQEIEKILGYKYYDEVIHRDNLVLL